VNRLPNFGFELMDIASKVGWKSVWDMKKHNVYVFCSDKCIPKNMKGK
jgi:hypothetical protein